jgi:hypothetical protein
MSDMVPTGQPPVVADEGGVLATVPKNLDPREGSGAVWASTMPTDDEGKAALFNMVMGQLPKLSSMMNIPINVTDIVRQQVELTNQSTGEVQPGVRTIVITDDGKAYSCVSKGISKSLGMLWYGYGPPPWKPARTVTLKQADLADGKRMFYFEDGGPATKKVKSGK